MVWVGLWLLVGARCLLVGVLWLVVCSWFAVAFRWLLGYVAGLGFAAGVFLRVLFAVVSVGGLLVADLGAALRGWLHGFAPCGFSGLGCRVVGLCLVGCLVV